MSSPAVTRGRCDADEIGSDVPRMRSDLEFTDRTESESSRPVSRNSTAYSTKTPPPLVKRTHSKRSAHMRSQSHNKSSIRLLTSANPVKPHLSRSKSTDGIPRAGRPGIKRNGRSYTKMTGLHPLTKTLSNGLLNRTLGLHPLTKTVSNGSMKQNTLKKTTLNSSAKMPLSKTHLDHSIRSQKSASSLKGLGLSSSMVGGTTGIKTSAKRGRVIMKLNEDAADDEFEDLSDSGTDEVEEISNSVLQRLFQPHEDNHIETQRGESVHEVRDNTGNGNTDTGTNASNDANGSNDVNCSNESNSANGTGDINDSNNTNHTNGADDTNDTHCNAGDTLPNSTDKPALNPATLGRLTLMDPDVVQQTNFISGSSSPEDLPKNLYGGSLLLSQSTGLTRKVDGPISYVSEESDLVKNQPNMSGIVFNARNDDKRRENVSGASYQPNQSIFSNLQRTNTQFLNRKKGQEQAKTDTNKDFLLFLAANSGDHHTHDTRTQQRLWLQRENSLMDVSHDAFANIPNMSSLSLNKLMFAHNYNNSMTNMQGAMPVVNGDNASLHPNTIPENSPSVTNLLYLVQSGHQSVQLRIEFERLNREYVNVRRHVNPVAESLNRIERFLAKGGLDVKKRMKNANSFQEFAPESEQHQEDAYNKVGRIWLEALLASSSSSVSLQLYKQEMQNMNLGMNTQGQIQSLTPSQSQSQSQSSMQSQLTQDLPGLVSNHMLNQKVQQELLRYRNRTATPTTRAVKMAQAAATPGQR